MPIAAVPKYMQENDPEFYLSAPPGHRFLLYFPAWGDNQQTGKIDWRMKDCVPKMKRKQGQLVREGWEDVPNDHYACTIVAGKTPLFNDEKPRRARAKLDPGLKPWQPLVEGLLARQSAAAALTPAEALFSLPAQAISPFTTGLGNEHPLENGFAFLNPYGLPYLPGSGVKGVLRQAAQELASGQWGETHGWRRSNERPYRINLGTEREPRWLELSMIDVLFGRETREGDKDHVRGALSFWDVIPQIAGESLLVEIMTPHQSHYYQQRSQAGSTNPHDSGQPNPICFLTVPPGSRFTFYVVCDVNHLRRLTQNKSSDAPDLLTEGEANWKTRLEAAFQHAFHWLGFGAKTAVGYGAMQRVAAAAQGHASESSQRKTAPAQPHCAWVEQKLAELCAKPGIKPDDALRSKALAEAVRAVENPDLRREAVADIVNRWKAKGWWDRPSGSSAKQAKAIYDELRKQQGTAESSFA